MVSTSTIRSTPSRSARAISPKYIILSGANRPAPREMRAMKVSVRTRTPAAAIRPAWRTPASRQVEPPIRMTGFFAALMRAAVASTTPAWAVTRTGFSSTGPFTVVSDQALSAGRIRLAQPPGAPKLARTASAAIGPTESGVSADLTHSELGAAQPAMSLFSGASYWR